MLTSDIINFVEAGLELADLYDSGEGFIDVSDLKDAFSSDEISDFIALVPTLVILELYDDGSGFTIEQLTNIFAPEQLANIFTYEQLENSLVDPENPSNGFFSDNIDVIYNISIERGQTVSFVSICYRTEQIQAEIINAQEYLLSVEILHRAI